MKKIFALLLALTLLVSLVPMSASAVGHWSSYVGVSKPDSNGNRVLYRADGGTEDATPEDYDALVEAYGAYLAGQEEFLKAANHDPNNHSYNGYGSNNKYHWFQCACGCKIGMEPHIDPKDAVNDYCYCGYQFSDNADLVVLWIDGCPGIKNFNKNTTEYKLNAYTYKDVKEIKIVTKTHDSEAIVELPEDLTLKAGENKFEVKVTSENQKVTKVYTVTVVK